jgi:hypothetical protein
MILKYILIILIVESSFIVPYNTLSIINNTIVISYIFKNRTNFMELYFPKFNNYIENYNKNLINLVKENMIYKFFELIIK